jgi:hypothetical protein
MRETLGSVQRGWTVYGIEDEKIGEVADVGANFLLVQKGLIFTNDIYIPTTAITEAHDEEQCVHIDVATGDVDSMGWDLEPSETVGQGHGTDQFGGTRETDRSGVTDQDSARPTVHEEELQAQGAGDLVGAGADRFQATRIDDDDRVTDAEEDRGRPGTTSSW